MQRISLRGTNENTFLKNEGEKFVKNLISVMVVKLGSPVAPGLGSPRSHKNYMPLVLLLGTALHEIPLCANVRF